MMYCAKRGYTPMIVIAGEAGIRYEALDGQMAADLTQIARPFVKSDHNGPCAWRAADSGSLLRLVRRAIKTAATPPMGPVFLALPMDVLDEPASEPIERTIPIASRVLPDEETISQAARLLAGAHHPLICGGWHLGVGRSTGTNGGRGAAGGRRLGWQLFRGEHGGLASPFQGALGHMFGEVSRPITSTADAILVCGTTLLPEVFPSVTGVFAPDAKVIHFDLNVSEIGKNFPCAVGALGDPKVTLASLTRELTQSWMQGSVKLPENASSGADERRTICAKRHLLQMRPPAPTADCIFPNSRRRLQRACRQMRSSSMRP